MLFDKEKYYINYEYIVSSCAQKRVDVAIFDKKDN